MEKCIEILDSLMKAKKEKKKKEPTIKEKEAFRSAWLSLVAHTGLTGRTEQFLYEGFAFCGAEPFYAYLIQTEDQNATLAALFSGKYYGIDSNVSFRLVAHLLALMLNNNAPRNAYYEILKPDTPICGWEHTCHFGIVDSSKEARFVFGGSPDIEASPERYKTLSVPAYRFLQEQIVLNASVDQNMVFTVVAGSNMQPAEFRRLWEYTQLKCYYKLPGKQVQHGE